MPYWFTLSSTNDDCPSGYGSVVVNKDLNEDDDLVVNFSKCEGEELTDPRLGDECLQVSRNIAHKFCGEKGEEVAICKQQLINSEDEQDYIQFRWKKVVRRCDLQIV